MKRGARSGIHNRPESVLFSSIEAVEERQLLSAATSPIDGVGHNESSPWWGSTETELIRYASPAYEDGLSSPAGSNRPGARLVSNQIVAQAESILNDRQMSDFVWMWGQLIDHDIDLTDPAVPAEDFSIDVPAGDPWFDPLATGTVQIDLARSVSVEGEESSDGMRQQLNSITAWLDGSVVYGSSNERANALRSFDGGRLRTSEGNLLPYNDAGLPNAGGSSSSLFLAGDVRANENIALSSMHILWVREHNRLCEELSAADSSLTDQELYEKARSIVAAEIQVITYNEFLPALLGNHAIAPYAGYDSSVNPTIANEFSTAAYRFGHSLLSPSLQRIDAFGSSIPEGALPLASAFFNPPALLSTGIDVLFRGAAVQAAQELDVQIVDGVRNFLFGEPGQGGLDLAS
ncbi:MAG: peroxidase, partial [Planctomycetaceae bacterium]|nr:peroxidase [Planctomycetaceae bacterium]